MRRPRLLIVIVILSSACSGAGDPAGAPASESTPAESVAPTTVGVTTAPTTDPVTSTLDLAGTCTYIDAEEMTAILANEVTASEGNRPEECVYESAGGVLAGAYGLVTVAAVDVATCEFFLQTEPLVNETVEPAPEYGPLASLIVDETFTRYDICVDGLSVIVQVNGYEAVSPQARLKAAGAILDLVLDRT